MRCIGLDQPYATLLVCGRKAWETRPKRMPRTLMGQRVAIHANLTRRCMGELDRIEEGLNIDGRLRPEFAFGAIVGSVFMVGSRVMTQEWISDLEDRDDEELHVGDWRPGRWAWETREASQLEVPVAWRGKQGVMIVPDGIA